MGNSQLRTGILLVGLIGVAAGAIEASATDKPLRIEIGDTKQSLQQCYTIFTIDHAGNWTSTARFANGRGLEGDRFRATLKLRNPSGKDVLAISQSTDVFPAGVCSPPGCIVLMENSGKVEATSMQLTRNVSYQCKSYVEEDDGELDESVEIAIHCKELDQPCEVHRKSDGLKR